METHSNNIPLPIREQQGTAPGDVRRNHDTSAVIVSAPTVISSAHLEWIMSTINRLESHFAATDRRPTDHRVPPRPDPDPPYALPLPTAVRENQPLPQPPNTAVTDHQFPPQPSITPPLSHNFPHYPEVTSYNRPPPHGFNPHQPLHHNIQPPLYGTDLLGQPQFSHPTMQPQPYHGQYYPSEQPSYWPVTTTVPQPPYGHPPLVDAGFHPPHTQPPDSPDRQQLYRPYDWGAYAARQPDAYKPYTQPTYVDGQPYTWKQLPRQYTTSTFGQPPYSSDAPFVQHGHGATSAFSQKPYTAQTTLMPLRTSFVDHQGSLTVDGVGVDLAHRYGRDNEHSSSHASRAEEGDGDAEINEIFKIGEEGEVLYDDPPPPAAISLPCNPGISPVLVFVLADTGPHSVPRDICILAKVLKQDQIWNDHTNFDDIFDADHFIQYLKTVTSGYYNWTWHFFAFDSGGDTSMLFVAYWFPP